MCACALFLECVVRFWDSPSGCICHMTITQCGVFFLSFHRVKCIGPCGTPRTVGIIWLSCPPGTRALSPPLYGTMSANVGGHWLHSCLRSLQASLQDACLGFAYWGITVVMFCLPEFFGTLSVRSLPLLPLWRQRSAYVSHQACDG